MIVYFNGNYIAKEKVAISPDDRGFLFADGVYEVIHAYHGRLFKAREHLSRLNIGLGELRIKGVDAMIFEDVSDRLLQENDLTNTEALIYMQITRGAAPRNHAFPAEGTSPTVYVEAKPYSPPLEVRNKGASAILVPDQRWGRCNIKTISLLPNTLAHQKAKEAGAFEAIFCADGLLLEGTHSSILFVKEEVLICPALTNRILPSVTRSIVLSLAEADSIDVEIRPCREGEVFEFQEMLMLGTGSEIVPIIALNSRRIGAGAPGRITRLLQKAFSNLTVQ
jgi:D-alanine transaminase